MRLLHPFGVFAEHLHRVVDAGQPQFLDALGSQVAVEVVDFGVGNELLECHAGVDREGDDLRLVQHAVFLELLDDLFGGEVFAVVIRKRLHFENQARVGFRGDEFQVGVERGDVLAVGQHDGRDLLGGGFLHVDVRAFVNAVVVDDQFVVGGEPYVDFRAEDTDGVGFRERSDRVLRRFGGCPVTAVCDYLGLGCDGASC